MKVKQKFLYSVYELGCLPTKVVAVCQQEAVNIVAHELEIGNKQELCVEYIGEVLVKENKLETFE